MSQRIRQYWEARAKEFSSSPEATTHDVYLRELEIETLVRTLGQIDVPEKATVIDVGCGDGYSTLKVAEALPACRVFGIDFSPNMICLAVERLGSRPALQGRVAFLEGDVMSLGNALGPDPFDVVVTDRCLINLESHDRQAHAIAEIARCIRPRGYYLAIENFIEGHNNMNSARRIMGLPDIPVRWHNLFFEEERFIRDTASFFELVAFEDFASSYYFATRVIYSALCRIRGEEPDYRHEVHRLAINLPWSGRFSPTRLAVLRRRLNAPEGGLHRAEQL